LNQLLSQIELKKRPHYVYIFKQHNEIVYVGSTNTLVARMNQHVNFRDGKLRYLGVWALTWEALRQHHVTIHLVWHFSEFTLYHFFRPKLNAVLPNGGTAFRFLENRNPKKIVTHQEHHFIYNWEKRKREEYIYSINFFASFSPATSTTRKYILEERLLLGEQSHALVGDLFCGKYRHSLRKHKRIHR
jgi:hypothetical protein